jgi:hypothetical protein
MLQVLGTKSEKYRIPEEVMELYEWRNGQTEGVPFFDVLRFQPFAEAVEYGNLVEEYFDGTFPLMIFQELFYDAGYQARCGLNEEKVVPAYRWDHGDDRIETESFTELLTAVAEGFESGVFRLNRSEGFDTDENTWDSILVRHHPDRIRCVRALLRREWTGLSSEQLRDAFYDLVRMNHPETPPLIHEFLGDNRDLPERDYNAFHAVFGAGFTIGDVWTRDFALTLIFSENVAARKAALLSLAWSWRGELRLTTQHIDALIHQIMSDPRSDSDNRERAMLLGVAGDRRAIPVLLLLLAECGSRDEAIATIRALARLEAVEAEPILVAMTQEQDPGTRISAIRALAELGFRDDRVEQAAKTYFREMFQRFGTWPEQEDSPVVQRWKDEAAESNAD